MFWDIVPKLKGTKVLYLCSNGEPLVYHRLFDGIEVARRYIPSVRFVTNGVLLSRDVGKELKKAGLSQLGVSIDSPDRALMLKIRGVSIETITNNVKEFCMGTGIPVEVRSTICAENVDSLKHLPVFAGNFSTCRLLYFTLAEGMSEVDSSPMTMLRNRKEFLGLKQAVVRQCRELGLYTNLEYMKFYPERFFDHARKGRCDSLFGRHLAINCKGYIMPCCRYWGHHLDNIGELSFAEAWNGRLTRSWRRQMLNRKYTDDCSNFCGYPGFPGE
jgi:MoaA/NifB/PqqE/SkfB family radical SAM enzyme